MAELWSVVRIPPFQSLTNGQWALSGQWSSEEKFPRCSTARGSDQWAMAILWPLAFPTLLTSLGFPAHIGQNWIAGQCRDENPPVNHLDFWPIIQRLFFPRPRACWWLFILVSWVAYFFRLKSALEPKVKCLLIMHMWIFDVQYKFFPILNSQHS